MDDTAKGGAVKRTEASPPTSPALSTHSQISATSLFSTGASCGVPTRLVNRNPQSRQPFQHKSSKLDTICSTSTDGYSLGPRQLPSIQTSPPDAIIKCESSDIVSGPSLLEQQEAEDLLLQLSMNLDQLVAGVTNNPTGFVPTGTSTGSANTSGADFMADITDLMNLDDFAVDHDIVLPDSHMAPHSIAPLYPNPSQCYQTSELLPAFDFDGLDLGLHQHTIAHRQALRHPEHVPITAISNAPRPGMSITTPSPFCASTHNKRPRQSSSPSLDDDSFKRTHLPTRLEINTSFATPANRPRDPASSFPTPVSATRAPPSNATRAACLPSPRTSVTYTSSKPYQHHTPTSSAGSSPSSSLPSPPPNAALPSLKRMSSSSSPPPASAMTPVRVGGRIPEQQKERVYACQSCPAAFRRSHDLKRHTRSLHTMVKPFRCVSCTKSFSRMDALKRHVGRPNSACFVDIANGAPLVVPPSEEDL
ncbi:hypothetical protein HK101_010839 [Irineochytrium annulatum]|nr:hypothetical protein HK101_010839 [Irineochytrium annulatum]